MKSGINLIILLICTQSYAATEQLRRGAAVFMQYCVGCHSLQAVRFPQLRQDLAIDTWDEQHLRAYNLPTQTSDLHTSLDKKAASNWFMRVPPDLSTIALSLGKAELKSYLYGFYPDTTRNFGSSNRKRPGINMPDVLAPIRQDTEKLNTTIDDLAEFLEYTADPSIKIRTQMGILFICIFIVVLIIYLYLMNM